MSELERIDELRAQQKELYEKWYAVERGVTEKLYEILNNLNEGPAKLLPLKSEETVDIENHDWLDDKVFWKIRKEIYFVNQDPNDTNREYDFGSSFSLYITNKNIQINHGSCGTWGLEDKGQWSRLLLMTAIFKNQEMIIESLAPYINFDDRKKLREVNREIDDIERAIRAAKEEKERQAIISQLAPGKYIAKMGYHYNYKLDENGNEVSSKEYYYYDFEKIIKITEKKIITEDHWHDRKWRNKNDYIYYIRCKNIYIVNNTDEVPPQKGIENE